MTELVVILEKLGPRESATAQESAALTMRESTSRNVIAEKSGAGEAVVVLGGHYDSVAGIAGANDNASGTAVFAGHSPEAREC